ncbi:M16 family metallopeptidase [Olivibacter sitiensis]|uniref:M16 family metallopeptidase n=1 Tax=Olivibacter sitiensis TaxID=376470 RepID=UPI0004240E61|nr:insulinase family protein [Olivibacter sitiensis]
MKNHKNYALAFFLLFVAGNGIAQEYEWKTEQSGGYTYRTVTDDPTKSRFYTLKNGLTIILSPTPKEPRIQCYIAVKAGSKTDPANHTGLAHYLEHMLFKGTDKFGSLDWSKEKPLLDEIDKLYEQYNSTTDSAQRKQIYANIDSVSGEAAKYAIANEYDKMMAGMGAQGTNAFTSFEQTVYTEDLPSTAVDKFLAVQAERFRSPVFRLFHTELEAVYEEKNRGLDSDSRKTFEAMFANLFPNSYGKQTTIGTIEHLKNPSLIAIREYYNTYYVPNNMAIILSGDFNPNEVIKKIDANFGFMQNKPVPPYTYDEEKSITTPVVKEVWGPNPESIMIGYRFPGASTKDAQLLELMGSILTNGKAGLFDLNLVKQQKLLSAAAFPYVLKDYSTLILQGNPIKDQSLDDVRNLMLAEIDKLKKGDFPESLLTGIVNNAKKATIQSNESYESRASNLMDAFTSGIDWKTRVAYDKTLAEITKDDIVAFANKYLKNNYVAVYKRQGEDKNMLKVEKPSITPVEVNRDAQSPFLQHIDAMAETKIEPKWLDFNKDINRTKVKGTELLSVENKDNAIFRLAYRFDIGSYNEKLLPIAAQYIQFIGTKDKTAEDISKAFYQLASSFSVSASTEITTISLSGLQENFDETVSLFEDLIRHAEPNEQALTGLKVRLQKARENAKLNKSAILQGLLSYAQYGEKNPFNNVLSDAELEAITAQELIDLLKDLLNYKPQIIYYGPKSGTDVAVVIDSLHAIPDSFKDYPTLVEFKKRDQQANEVYFAHYDMVQAEIDWFRNAEVYDPNKTAIIQLFNNYFGGGMSGIVFQTIRESKALAYSTYAYYSSPAKKDDRYSIVAYVGTQADKMNEAIAGMNDLINNLPESEKVFQTGKESLLKSLVTSRITEDGIIYSYLSAKRLGIDYDMRQKVYSEAQKLNFANLKAFHDSEFKNKPYAYCIVGSKERIPTADLEKYGTVKELDLSTLFGY